MGEMISLNKSISPLLRIPSTIVFILLLIGSTPTYQQELPVLGKKHHYLEHIKVIGAGQGTTGTTSMFREMCQMKLPTIHCGENCAMIDRNKAKKLNKFDALDGKFRARVINQNSLEIDEKKKSNATATLFSLEAAMEHLLVYLFERGTHVQAIIDSPVGYMFDEFYMAAPINVKVILTLRDPVAWAISRIKNHGGEYICRESAFLFNPKTNKTESAENIAETTEDSMLLLKNQNKLLLPPLPHAFAFWACLKRASVREQTTQKVAKNFPFTTITEFIELAQKNSKAKITYEPLAAAYSQYNDHIRKVVPAKNLLEFNLWKDDPCKFHTQVEAFLGLSLNEKYRSTFLGVKVGVDKYEKDNFKKAVISEQCPCVPSFNVTCPSSLLMGVMKHHHRSQSNMTSVMRGGVRPRPVITTYAQQSSPSSAHVPNSIGQGQPPQTQSQNQQPRQQAHTSQQQPRPNSGAPPPPKPRPQSNQPRQQSGPQSYNQQPRPNGAAAAAPNSRPQSNQPRQQAHTYQQPRPNSGAAAPNSRPQSVQNKKLLKGFTPV